MSLVMTLATRNLLHDRLRFVATLIGIVFSVVLVMVQMGLFLGFGPHGLDHDRPRQCRYLGAAERREMF